MATGERSRAACASRSSTSASGVAAARGRAVVKATVSASVSSLAASATGSTRRSLAAALSAATADVAAVSDRRDGEQAQQHGEGLVVGEHQRRQAVARGEPVAAVAAAHRADRDVQVDEVGHVAPHGALVDAEAFGQLGDRAGAARLQDLQQGQHPGGGTGHTAQIPGGMCPVFVSSVDRDGGIGPPEALAGASHEPRVDPPHHRRRPAPRRLLRAGHRRAGAWSTPDFAEIGTPAGTLAIGHTRTVALFGAGSARPADNHTAIIEFLVADVDAEYARLRETVDDVRERADHDAVGQPVAALPRPRRQPGQLLHPGHAGGDRQVRALT